jgi:hypothetical protein
VLILALMASFSVEAAQVSLAWELSADSVGYRVYYGNQSGSYTNTQEAGNTTNTTLTGLTPGDYYFVVVAYNQDGLESFPSDEVSTTLSNPAELQIILNDPKNGEKINGPRPINLSATVTATGAQSIRAVEYFSNGQKIGEAASAPYSFSWEGAGLGNHSLSARVFTTTGESANSPAVAVTMFQLRTTSFEMRPDGSGAQFIVEAAPGTTNEIYASSDLIHWTLISTVENPTGAVSVRDPEAATASRRFYKVRAR